MDITKPILVLGGTGHYGRHIVQSLLNKNEAVRVLSRNPAQARKLLGEKLEIIKGDVLSAESIAQAVDGVKAIVIALSAFTPKLIGQLEAIELDAVLQVLATANKAGVNRIVYISAYDLNQALTDRLKLKTPKIKQHIENFLLKSDFNWTVLGAAPSMEIFFAMTRGDVMAVPGGGPPALPTISPVDLGEITAQTTLRNDLSGRRIRLTGPEALSFPQAANRIATITGKPIKFRKIPLILPTIARNIIKPFKPICNMLQYIYEMIGYIKLLNQFPQAIAKEVPIDHQYLITTFDYQPTTFEAEIKRRFK